MPNRRRHRTARTGIAIECLENRTLLTGCTLPGVDVRDDLEVSVDLGGPAQIGVGGRLDRDASFSFYKEAILHGVIAVISYGDGARDFLSSRPQPGYELYDFANNEFPLTHTYGRAGTFRAHVLLGIVASALGPRSGIGMACGDMVVTVTNSPTPPPPADIVFPVAPTHFTRDGFVINYEIQNGPIGPFGVSVYRSEDEHLDGDDELIASTNAPGGESGRHSLQVETRIPGINPSKPYVIVVADRAGVIPELDEDNNTTVFRKRVLSYVVHGFQVSGTISLDPEDIEKNEITRLSQDIQTTAGYSLVETFDWASASRIPFPDLAVLAGRRLARRILTDIRSTPLLGFGPIDLHLIGHSRGAVVISEAFRQLGELGQLPGRLAAGHWKMTMIDPHPARNPATRDWFSADPSNIEAVLAVHIYQVFQFLARDPDVSIPERVNESEGYFQNTPWFELGGTERTLNLWGEHPIGNAFLCDLTGPGIGHGGIVAEYRTMVVKELSQGATQVCDSRSDLVQVGLTDDGVLGVHGGSALGHEVTIQESGEDTVIRVAALRGDSPEVFRFPTTDVRQIGVSAGRGADRITLSGSSRPAVIDAGDGPDSVTGGTSSNTILGGAGDDTLAGGPGSDIILGGAGRDLILGHGGNDRLNGGRHRDTLDGGNGNDRLVGRGGADELYGRAGADRLLGGAGNDFLSGGTGDDFLHGQRGLHDELAGGPGANRTLGGFPVTERAALNSLPVVVATEGHSPDEDQCELIVALPGNVAAPVSVDLQHDVNSDAPTDASPEGIVHTVSSSFADWMAWSDRVGSKKSADA